MSATGIAHSELTAIVRKAMVACAKKGTRRACDECPLIMHCPAHRP